MRGEYLCLAQTNKEIGQLVLEHVDSNVLVGSFDESVDVAGTLKNKAFELQRGLSNPSNSGFTQSNIEAVNGSALPGSVVRIEYNKRAEGRIHIDLYILSAVESN